MRLQGKWEWKKGSSSSPPAKDSVMLEKIEFLGHASIKVNGSKIVYIDPYQIDEQEKADIILVTHSHFDHLSVEDIEKICTEDTTIVASQDCLDALERLPGHTVGIAPFQHANVNGVHIDAIPAYNISKEFHPRDKNWNGYVFVLDGVRYYHPGDTDKIPEMSSVKTDVAFLPVGGTYTMNYEQAAEAVSMFHPKIAVPIHYGRIVGSEDDAQKFVSLVGEKGYIIPSKS
jgi:L-ascorbate metabolism protein UlaG (beta-lactamase superfamily)